MAHSLPSLRATLIAVSSAVCTALPLAASAAGFDSSAEGWTTTNGGAQTWVAGGGNGGGWLRVADDSNDDFLLNAPAAWLGNWSGLLGGTLSFDALNVNNESPDWAPFGEVVITGAAGSVVLDAVAANQPPADGLWHTYSVTLSPAAGWSGASLAAVLANVTSLTIKGEFHAGVSEVVGIDNIQVSAVPEPANAALLLGGIALLATLRRKR
jgi:Laminin B (Domain IV)